MGMAGNVGVHVVLCHYLPELIPLCRVMAETVEVFQGVRVRERVAEYKDMADPPCFCRCKVLVKSGNLPAIDIKEMGVGGLSGIVMAGVERNNV